MRYAGWILTCPVLLMTLVSMTTEDGTKAPTVRLVPLLVANLTMVILGITAAANLPPVKWYVQLRHGAQTRTRNRSRRRALTLATTLTRYIFAMALCFGGHVFSSAIQCFLALYEQSPNSPVRRASLWLCLTFLGGWGCFPCAFLAGHSGMKIISVDVQWGLFVVGDMLSKNCWVALAVRRSLCAQAATPRARAATLRAQAATLCAQVLRQYQLDQHVDKLEADLEIADYASRASRGMEMASRGNPAARPGAMLDPNPNPNPSPSPSPSPNPNPNPNPSPSPNPNQEPCSSGAAPTHA